MILKSDLFIENPLVSVIIPSYNRAITVSQTIDSILNQKCNFDFEIVIGDDCSTDNAREVLLEYQKKYSQHIVLLFHEQNIGLGANWATCVKNCKGKYIANCDNDDYWHNKDKLQLQVDFFESHLAENVIITDHRNHNRITEVITEEKAYIDQSLSLQQAIFRGFTKFCNATIMYRKDFLVNHIHLDDFINFKFTLQDWNTWMILSAYTNFYILPVSTATFGIETESITRPNSYENIENRFKKERECYQYVCELFPDALPFDEKGYDSYVNSVLLNLAYKQKDYSKAKEFGKEIGRKSLKVICSQNRILFWIFVLFKRIKNS